MSFIGGPVAGSGASIRFSPAIGVAGREACGFLARLVAKAHTVCRGIRDKKYGRAPMAAIATSFPDLRRSPSGAHLKAQRSTALADGRAPPPGRFRLAPAIAVARQPAVRKIELKILPLSGATFSNLEPTLNSQSRAPALLPARSQLQFW